MRRLITLIALISLLAALAPIYASCTVATLKYGTKLLNVTVNYCAKGNCGSVTAKNGTVKIPTAPPVNISFTYDKVLYIVEISSNATTIDVSKLPYSGNLTSNVEVRGAVLKNTMISLTFKELTIRFNKPVEISLPETLISPPFGIYKLSNVKTSGDVKYVNTSRIIVFTGSGSVDITYRTVTMFGIPLIYILLGIAVLLIIIAVLARRGTLMSRSRRQMFKLSS